MKNWKTTLAGLSAALAITTQAQFSVSSILTGAGIFLTALFAKDADVTGGTRPQ